MWPMKRTAIDSATEERMDVKVSSSLSKYSELAHTYIGAHNEMLARRMLDHIFMWLT